MTWSDFQADVARALQRPEVVAAVRVVERVEAVTGRLMSLGTARPRARGAVVLGLLLVCGLVMAASTKAAPPPPLPVAPGGAFLDFVLRNSNSTFMRWMTTAKTYALGLFGPLLVCQIVLVGKKASQEGFFAGVAGLVDVVMRKGIWAYFLWNVETLATGIPDGIAHVGNVIAGSNVEGQPTQYVDLAKVTFVNLVQASWKGGLMDFGATAAISLFAGLVILVVFVAAAWVLALTLMYVKVVAVGGLLLVGLSGLDFTSKYAWRYVEFLVRGGLKQLGVALVLGLSASSVQQWRMQADLATMPGVDAHLLALDMLASSVGLLFLLLLVPQLTSSIASGGLGDTGESKIGGALGAASQAVAMGVVARFLGQAMPGASAGAVPSAGAGQTPEQRAQMLVQAASAGLGGGSGVVSDASAAGGAGVAGGGAGAAKRPAGPGGAAQGAGAQGPDVAGQIGRTAGAMARGMRGNAPEEADDE